MEILVDIETAGGPTPVTILRPHGKIDGSNFESLVNHAKQLYASGVRRLLLDMGDVSFLSSAGLVALHRIVMIFSEKKIQEDQSGWDALADIERNVGNSPQPFVKLLNLQPKVAGTLQMAGMDQFFQTFTDEKTAVDSF
jgi:anti-anti-sigma factor